MSPPMGTSQILPYPLPPTSLTLTSCSYGIHLPRPTRCRERTPSTLVLQLLHPSRQTPLTLSHHLRRPRMTGVHPPMLKPGSAFLYYKTSRMGWTPRTKMRMKKTRCGEGSGAVEGLMYTHSEDGDHERRRTFEVKNISTIPLTTPPELNHPPLMPSSLQPPHPYFLRSAVPPNANIDHR